MNIWVVSTLSIMNSAAMNIYIQISVWQYFFHISWLYILEYISSSYCDLCLKFWGNTFFFFFTEAVVPLYNPTISVKGFQFLQILTNTCHISVLIIATVMEVLICIFLTANNFCSLFICLLFIQIFYLEECLFREFSNFLSVRLFFEF